LKRTTQDFHPNYDLLLNLAWDMFSHAVGIIASTSCGRVKIVLYPLNFKHAGAPGLFSFSQQAARIVRSDLIDGGVGEKVCG
jgi:hypothetical protein